MLLNSVRQTRPLVALLFLLALLISSTMPALAQVGLAHALLSTTLPNHGYVSFFQISPDGKYVTYHANDSAGDYWGLFSVAVDSGKVVELDRLSFSHLAVASATEPDIICCPIPEGVSHHEISPDSKWVLFQVQYADLYSVPIGGGTPVLLNEPGEAPFNTPFIVTPDSRYVVYANNTADPAQSHIVVVPIGGGPLTAIAVPSSGSDSYYSYSALFVTQDSKKVVFVASNSNGNTTDLYVAPLTGGTPAKLNPPFANERSVGTFPIPSLATGNNVVYLADQEHDEVYELYRVSIDGGPATKLNDPLAAGETVGHYQLSVDGQRVVYHVYKPGDNDSKLYSVGVNSGAPVELQLQDDDNMRPYPEYVLTKDSRKVIYMAVSISTALPTGLYSIPIEGGVPTLLNRPLSDQELLGLWAVSPNGKQVAYTIRIGEGPEVDFYTVSTAGGSTVKIDHAETKHRVNELEFTPNSEYVLFTGRTEGLRDQLFRVAVGTVHPERVNGDVVEQGGVPEAGGFDGIPNSNTVVYIVAQKSPTEFELFKAYEVEFEYKMLVPAVGAESPVNP